MSFIHDFKIRPICESAYQVYIDGKKVALRSVDVRLRSDEFPTVKCEFAAKNDIDIQTVLELSDSEVLEMVKRRLKDDEFFKSLMWIIADESRI